MAGGLRGFLYDLAGRPRRRRRGRRTQPRDGRDPRNGSRLRGDRRAGEDRSRGRAQRRDARRMSSATRSRPRRAIGLLRADHVDGAEAGVTPSLGSVGFAGSTATR